MKLREYRASDCPELTRLFYDTVHSVCAGEYTPEQLDAWADGRPDLKAWARSLSAHDTLVAEEEGRILGFGDMTRRATWTVCSCTGRPRAGGSPPPCAPRWRAAAPPRSLRSTRQRPHGPSSRAGDTRSCGNSRWNAGGVLLANFVMTRPASEGTKKNKSYSIEMKNKIKKLTLIKLNDIVGTERRREDAH